jgi:DNA-binding CsgD family transcriptional regulator
LNRLLLIGSEDAFKSDMTRRVFGGHPFRIAARSTTLLGALGRLESRAIDLVLLSREFSTEELSLFAFDAHRRGFAGLILQVASTTGEAAAVASAGNGSQGFSPGRPSGQHWPYSQFVDAQTHLAANEPSDSILFTAKQQAVLTRVSEGWTNRQIARHLQCSEGSIKAVLQELFNKLGVRKRAQIVRMAFEKAPWNPGQAPISRGQA